MPRPTLPPTIPILVNAAELDAVPATLYAATTLGHQRSLSRADWLIRRKADGVYLGTWSLHAQWQPWIRGDLIQRGALQALLDRLASRAPRNEPHSVSARAPIRALGMDIEDYAARTGLAWQPEPARLYHAGGDRYARPLWLTEAACHAWHAMRAAAQCDGVALEAISGFRSQAYQLGIFRRKLARGLSLDAILHVNAAPGFSEHHSGEAIDIGTPGEPAAEESFEHTLAFSWLQQHAQRFGFGMSYPRKNPHGISFEPWHWRFRPPVTGRATGSESG